MDRRGCNSRLLVGFFMSSAWYSNDVELTAWTCPVLRFPPEAASGAAHLQGMRGTLVDGQELGGGRTDENADTKLRSLHPSIQ